MKPVEAGNVAALKGIPDQALFIVAEGHDAVRDLAVMASVKADIAVRRLYK